MRIIGGSNKRRVLKAPSGLPARPTTDMAKEALFNIINNHFDFETLRVLDLFAGTGNISFEFASRGAVEVVAVELNKRCTDYIAKTAESMQFDNIAVIRADVFRFIGRSRSIYDIIFADPPYDMRDIRLIPDMLIRNKLLSKGGWFVMEHHGSLQFDSHPAFLEKRKYGKVNFSFFSTQQEGTGIPE